MRNVLLVCLLLLMAGLAVYQNVRPSAEVSRSGSPDAESRAGSLAVDEKPAIGFRAPAFRLSTLDGKDVAFPSGTKPAVINFWASWCGPCKLEAPDLVRLYEAYKDRADFYAINLTDTDNLEDVRQFVNAYRFSLPVLLDEDGAVANRYAVRGIPTTFYVNADGVIVDVVVGVVPYAEMERRVKKAVGE